MHNMNWQYQLNWLRYISGRDATLESTLLAISLWWHKYGNGEILSFNLMAEFLTLKGPQRAIFMGPSWLPVKSMSVARA